MIKRILFLGFCLLTGFQSVATEKPLSYFTKKYNLPDNVNVLSVFSNDCINCYYGFSMFLKSHEDDFKKKDFVFLFKKEAEVDNIFKYQLGLDKTGCSVIVDDDFYKALDKHLVTTLTIIEDKKIREQFTSKDIYTFKSFAGVPPSGTLNLMETDTLDLRSRFGTKKLSIDLLNESKMMVYNQYTNDIFLFDLAGKKVIDKLPLSSFTNRYDSVIRILLRNKPEELRYNLENYKTNDYYKTFPLCKIKKVSCAEGSVFVGLSFTYMVKDGENHILYDGLEMIAKLDGDLNLIQLYQLRESIPGVEGKYISLMGYSFINADTVVFSLSSSGDRKQDSVAVLYSLKTNDAKVIELGYEPFMPLKGENGYYNYYRFSVWKDENELKGYFTKSPFIYNFSAKTKTLLPGLGIDPKTFDLKEKDKFFWISKVFSYQNNKCVIAVLKQKEMYLLQYDKELKTLISKKKIFDGYLSDIFVLKNTLFAFEDYSEKGDVAVLHKYQLK